MSFWTDLTRKKRKVTHTGMGFEAARKMGRVGGYWGLTDMVTRGLSGSTKVTKSSILGRGYTRSTYNPQGKLNAILAGSNQLDLAANQEADKQAKKRQINSQAFGTQSMYA